MELHHVRRGSGEPILLVHGLGARWQSWEPILDGLAAEREVIAVDLPGFGETPPLAGEQSIATLCDAVAGFIDRHDLGAVDLVGSSMGARMVLELARRGVGGAVVALDPGGFWSDGELRFFRVTIGASFALVRALQPVMPALTGNPFTRTVLFAQLSARPWSLRSDVALAEVRSIAASPSTDALFSDLVHGPRQEGAPAGSLAHPVTIGWGRKDRLTLPAQAARAVAKFPDAALHWFARSGHFPHWDEPEEAVRLILSSTGQGSRKNGLA
jgi:pimeloyl-ACP methyl ester carboxylesterase